MREHILPEVTFSIVRINPINIDPDRAAIIHEHMDKINVALIAESYPVAFKEMVPAEKIEGRKIAEIKATFRYHIMNHIKKYGVILKYDCPCCGASKAIEYLERIDRPNSGVTDLGAIQNEFYRVVTPKTADLLSIIAREVRYHPLFLAGRLIALAKATIADNSLNFDTLSPAHLCILATAASRAEEITENKMVCPQCLDFVDLLRQKRPNILAAQAAKDIPIPPLNTEAQNITSQEDDNTSPSGKNDPYRILLYPSSEHSKMERNINKLHKLGYSPIGRMVIDSKDNLIQTMSRVSAENPYPNEQLISPFKCPECGHALQRIKQFEGRGFHWICTKQGCRKTYGDRRSHPIFT